jgi:hypothetical protein
MNREVIKLTDEEMEDFDFTGGRQWELRGETYKFITEIRTDAMSDGPSWDIVVQRESDNKYFKWNVWEHPREYYMESGDNYMTEAFQEKTITYV